MEAYKLKTDQDEDVQAAKLMIRAMRSKEQEQWEKEDKERSEIFNKQRLELLERRRQWEKENPGKSEIFNKQEVERRRRAKELEEEGN